MTIGFTTPQNDADLHQILALQQANQKQNIDTETAKSQGFVTVVHDFDLLKKMNEAAPQVIAKDGDKVVGYALVMPESFSALIPVLTPMFEMLATLSFRGIPIKDRPFYAMGQICVAEGYRGFGVFDGLYQHHKALYASTYDVIATEISVSNARSMKAHQRVGFETIHTFKDATDDWNIVAWDWR